MALIVDSTGKPFADLPVGGRARAHVDGAARASLSRLIRASSRTRPRTSRRPRWVNGFRTSARRIQRSTSSAIAWSRAR
ncbi:hypothetical protein BZM27_53420, partial [Paraburkholderia steynii]